MRKGKLYLFRYSIDEHLSLRTIREEDAK